MKLTAILLLLISNSGLFSQEKHKIYTWEEAQNLGRDTIYAITFEKMKIDSLPIALFEFKNLIELNLSKNRISKLPFEMKNLSKLETLNLDKNNFTLFPLVVCELTSLKVLVLSRNDLYFLPDNFFKLNNLENLDIWDTPIATFPDCIVEMKNLKKIDARGISHGVKYQNNWIEKLSWVKIYFDAPCNCAN